MTIINQDRLEEVMDIYSITYADIARKAEYMNQAHLLRAVTGEISLTERSKRRIELGLLSLGIGDKDVQEILGETT